MGILRWLKEKSSEEAKLARLERRVEAEELKAKFAEQELPLLQRKDKAESVINLRDSVRRDIRNRKLKKIKKFIPKPVDSNLGGSIKLKTPSDRLYKS